MKSAEVGYHGIDGESTGNRRKRLKGHFRIMPNTFSHRAATPSYAPIQYGNVRKAVSLQTWKLE